jgi:Ca2+-binding RTX toxin-like protein
MDFLEGGLGNDTYIVDSTNVTITEIGEDTDTVLASVSYILAENTEILILSGRNNINGFGNALDNTITGNSGNNILSGGGGTDTLIGGVGNDTYMVDSTSETTIIENSGGGTDMVWSSTTYTLGTNLENLILTGIENIDGTGNTANNSITGNSGNNILEGGIGRDTLSGGAGNDTLIGTSISDPSLGGRSIDILTGGTGDDLFVLGNASGVFYNDGSTRSSGKSDYAQITDFGTGDKIQLKGSAKDYLLKTGDTIAGIPGSGFGLYLNDGVGSGATSRLDSLDEFIGFIRVQSGVSPLNLNDSSQFSFIA